MSLKWPTSFEVSSLSWVTGVILFVVCVLLFLQFRHLMLWNSVIKQYDPKSPFMVPRKKRVLQIAMTLLVMCGLASMLVFQPSISSHETARKVEGLNLFFLIDVSNSMNIEEDGMTRLEVVKQHIEVKLRQSGEGHAFGLAIFTSSFYFMSPLTSDLDTFLYIMRSINPGMLQSRGTRLSDAMRDLLDVVKTVQENSDLGEVYRVPYFVVFSDGEDFSEKPFELKGYEDFKGQFLFVGVGRDKAMPVPVFRNGKKVFLTDESGKIVMSRAEFDTMQTLAKNTGGHFRRLTENPLKDLLSKKGTLAGTTVEKIELKKPAYEIFGLFVLVLLFLKFLWRHQISFWVLWLALMLPNTLLASGPLSYFRHKGAQQDFKAGKIDEAKEKLKKNIHDKDVADLEHYNLGVLEAMQEHPEEAEEHFQKSESLMREREALRSNHLKEKVYRPFAQGLQALQQQKLQEGIEYLKRSLDESMQMPDEETWVKDFQDNTRWHLMSALKQQQQQEQQQQQQQEGEGEQQDQEEQSGKSDESQQDQQQEGQQGSDQQQQAGQGEEQEEQQQQQAAGGDDQEEEQPQVTEEDIARAEEMKKRLMELKLRQDRPNADQRQGPLFIPFGQEREDAKDEAQGPQY